LFGVGEEYNPKVSSAGIFSVTTSYFLLYWYTSNLTFGFNNEPLWKEDVQHPEDHVIFPGSNKSYWKDGKWVKQEIIQEQPVRRN